MLVGARPDIGRMDATLPVSQAVVALLGNEHPGDTPVVPLGVAIGGDGIASRSLPM